MQISAPHPSPVGDEAASPSSSNRLEAAYACGVLALAVLVRVLFLADKPLWRDEAWVALLVGDPLRAATEGRAVPFGFLALTHLFSRLPWFSPEVSYRLLPLLGGLALVPLLAKLATGLGASRRVGLAAMAIAAGLQPFVYYSRELKSYGFDALVAVLVPLLGVAAFGGTSSTRRSRAAFVVALVIAPWISFAGVFAVGALLAWGSIVWWRRGSPERRRAWLFACVAFVASFAALYAFALGDQASDPLMQTYWKPVLRRDDALALPLRLALAMGRYGQVAGTYLFRDLWPAALVLAVVGACTWPRPGRGFLAFQAAVTAGLCAVAVVGDHYLLVSGRLLLVAAPVPLLWIAGGLAALGQRLGSRPGATVALGIPLLLALGWSVQSVQHRVAPYRTNGGDFFRYDVLHDVDRLVAIGAQRIPAGQPVLVSRRCTYAFQFYRRGRWKNLTACSREDDRCDTKALGWMGKRPGRGWILMTEEETGWFQRQLAAAGLWYRERALERGVRLWEVGRKAPARTPGTARRRTPTGEPHGGT